jgi:hypothetical protein
MFRIWMSQRHVVWSLSQLLRSPGPLIAERNELSPERGFDELGVNQGKGVLAR